MIIRRRKLFCFGIAASVILIFINFFSCRFSDKKNPAPVKTVINSEIYKPPSIPMVFRTPSQQADYLAEHYWDNFNFSDSSAVINSKTVEQAFADYIAILRKAEPAKGIQGIVILANRTATENKTFFLFLQLAERYLHNPNSPFRNELFYEPFLKAALTFDSIDDNNKICYQRQLDLSQKNKPGNKAVNFSFTLINGTSSTLYKITSKLLLIYFHNPDCQECQTVKEKLVHSDLIRRFAERGDLKILSVYPDPDPAIWKQHYSELPSNWINSFDSGAVIKEKELYDLKAIPTLYLLDANKTVLLRDGSYEQVENYLFTLN